MTTTGVSNIAHQNHLDHRATPTLPFTAEADGYQNHFSITPSIKKAKMTKQTASLLG